MAVSENYGKVSILRIGNDEPVFILRAQDKSAEAAIEMYKALVTSHGSPLAKDIQKEIDVFKSWSGRKKSPDKLKSLGSCAEEKKADDGRTGGLHIRSSAERR